MLAWEASGLVSSPSGVVLGAGVEGGGAEIFLNSITLKGAFPYHNSTARCDTNSVVRAAQTYVIHSAFFKSRKAFSKTIHALTG